jgi:SGNH hydrolase-like domain, acetyltransferase AlgX
MKVNYRHTLLLLVMVVLFLPIIQSFMPVVLEKDLKGYFELKSKPLLNSNDYFSSKYQEEYMQYLDGALPLKATITRIYNQVLFSIFNQTNVNDVQIGENGYLFESPYIKEFNGEQFNGSAMNQEKVKRLVAIHNYLESKNKKLIIVFAPGKASMYPKYFPKKYRKSITDSTNYFTLNLALKNTKLHFIDFRDYFIKYNDTSTHSIMGKKGVHWTNYGSHLASDSIIRMMENLTNTDITDKIYIYNEFSTIARGTDDDIAQSMNLLWYTNNQMYTYPIVEYKSEGKWKPKVSVVGDSYWWTINNNFSPANQFSEYYFMYYFKHTYDFEKEISAEVSDENLKQYINNSDFIVLMATEANFNWFPYGFIEQFEKVFLQNK